MIRLYKGALWGPPAPDGSRGCAGSFSTMDRDEAEAGVAQVLALLEPGMIVMIEVVEGEGNA